MGFCLHTRNLTEEKGPTENSHAVRRVLVSYAPSRGPRCIQTLCVYFVLPDGWFDMSLLVPSDFVRNLSSSYGCYCFPDFHVFRPFFSTFSLLCFFYLLPIHASESCSLPTLYKVYCRYTHAIQRTIHRCWKCQKRVGKK